MVIRILSLIGLLALSLTGPLWLLFAALVAYAVVYTGPELLLVGFFIDGFYTYHLHTWPYYTLAIAVVLIVVTLVRPYTTFYHQQ